MREERLGEEKQGAHPPKEWVGSVPFLSLSSISLQEGLKSEESVLIYVCASVV